MIIPGVRDFVNLFWVSNKTMAVVTHGGATGNSWEIQSAGIGNRVHLLVMVLGRPPQLMLLSCGDGGLGVSPDTETNRSKEEHMFDIHPSAVDW